ncbi:calcium-binding mitochondrial carrier protein Aralar2 [Viridothelium virens]|uniref:Calcium-binding mitochondrial carrier protein Aralar2 n=1 Tax=Viridothelium virens TaxID=1048519 RepID=A0A6A6GWX6_VIRVR|nr:calcium-binding mitochondrial carrier protein Aralar2 [Viridothelium virens]
MSSPSVPGDQRLPSTPSKAIQAVIPQPGETVPVLPTKQQNGAPVAAANAPLGKSWAHFVAGGLGGMTASTITCPLDVLRTRLQSDFYQTQLAATRAARGIPPLSQLSPARGAILHITETFQILFAIPRQEGWRALFKGLGPNLVAVIPAQATKFFTYGNGKKIISKYLNDGRESAWVHLCAAATSGIITGTVTNPIWLVKTRLQLDRSHAERAGSVQARRYKNALDCTMQTVRNEGVRGLYRGLSASYLGITESTLQWVLYEQMKLYLRKRDERIALSGRLTTGWDDTVTWTGKLGAAGMAKFVAAIVTYPHEVVRTRLRQAPLETGRPKYTGLVQCFKLVFKEEGMVGLYGGLVPHMMRVVPSAAIMFGVYEVVLKLLGTTSEV